MRRWAIVVLLAGAATAGCGGSGSGSGNGGAGIGGAVGGTACSLSNQREFVFDVMDDWYLFQDLLPGDVTPDSAQTPEALLDLLIAPARAEGLDRNFSGLTTIEQDQAFFGEGEFFGFGFGVRADGGNVRISQVIGDSPAAEAGLRRGDRIVRLNNAEVNSLEDFNRQIALVPEDGSLRLDNECFEDGAFATAYTTEMVRDVVVTEPVPDFFTIARNGGRSVGYLDFRSFISTAVPRLDQAFALFNAENVTELIVDLRYNGGGLLSVARDLGDLIAGEIAAQEVFYELRFNATRSNENRAVVFEPFENLSLVPARVIFITTGSSASASELVINGVLPHVDVAVVGAPTFGKPVGQSAFDLEACDLRLRPVTFQTVNSLGDGDFFDGIAPRPTSSCAAADDLDFQIGNTGEASLQVALDYADTGTCDPHTAEAVTMPARIAPSAADFHAQRYLGVY